MQKDAHNHAECGCCQSDAFSFCNMRNGTEAKQSNDMVALPCKKVW